MSQKGLIFVVKTRRNVLKKMKKLYFSILMLVVLGMPVRAQERQLMCHAIAFYNLENLFDTVHDEGKNDYDFLRLQATLSANNPNPHLQPVSSLNHTSADEHHPVLSLGGDILYEVRFDSGEVKKLMATYAKLKKE